MALYSVEVLIERYALFYVAADSEIQAREDAEELADTLDANEFEDDAQLVVQEADFPSFGRWVWSGGPQGKLISAEQWQKGIHS